MKDYLKSQTIYQVYVRNFSKEGTFKKVIEKLDYIKDLGTDILYLLPIHEIGVVNHKGSLGCPYSIKDYYSIAPELGTLEDFKLLIEETHKKGMKIMMDIVFNHTSRDSVLLNTHPEWFFKRNDGSFGSKAGDWTDVFDVDHSHKELDEYMSDNLVYWAKLGVDGFRFDVASLIPLSFYKLARKKLNKVNKNIIFLAEAIEYSFNSYLRSLGYVAECDADLFKYFDLAYNYDSWPYLRDHIQQNKPIDDYKLLAVTEDAMLPANALRARAFENHDQERLADYLDELHLRHYLAYSFFLKGTGFIYNGQELMAHHRPSLFDKEVIDMEVNDSNINYLNFTKKMISLKHNKLNNKLLVSLIDSNNSDKDLFIVHNVFKGNKELIGLFNLSTDKENVYLSKEDVEKYQGTYKDLISGKTIHIKGESFKVSEPLYLKKVR